MPSDADSTGGIQQKLKRRKKFALAIVIGESFFVFGLIIGRYSTTLHQTWYAAVPSQYFPTPPEHLWFWLFGVGLHLLYVALAVYYAKWCDGQLTRLQGFNES